MLPPSIGIDDGLTIARAGSETCGVTHCEGLMAVKC